ncbi:hypothetical protein IDH44_15670 [Paenibacillus sp. IB182496]|uniref:Uncharacterized protein n=1 Tax=Paenibacillus sabuli TaxID=2772509 RepID=A0A927BWH4_9BACL|nr:hypothetical protein [Paenibacillus sabuli]MBD2846638.1 hypothetical protein [Paenibacillus sabuli]
MKLAAGLLLIIMSVVHVIYGENMQVRALRAQGAEENLVGAFRVMSLQGGLLLLAVGSIEVLGYAGLLRLDGFAAYMPAGLVGLNVLAALLVACTMHRKLLGMIVPQLLIFAVILTLQIWSAAG